MGGELGNTPSAKPFTLSREDLKAGGKEAEGRCVFARKRRSAKKGGPEGEMGQERLALCNSQHLSQKP